MIINPNGQEIIRLEKDFLGRKLSLEVGRMGFRSTASVTARYGDTVVMANIAVGQKPVTMDYFPMSVDYEERFYAAGKISGSRFIKREGRPSDEAVLIGRLIDRPIRPLFPKGYRQEVQIVATVLSMDPEFRPDMVAMLATSAALNLAGVPFDGPIAGLRVGKVDGKYKAFLSREEREKSILDLVVAGRKDGVMMVEAGANEAGEEDLIDAIGWAHENYQPLIEMQDELREKVGVTELKYELVKPTEKIFEEAMEWTTGKLGDAIRTAYPERNELIGTMKAEFHAEMAEKYGEEYEKNWAEYDEAFTAAVHQDSRDGIVKNGVRPDGRKLDQVRQLSSEVGILPRTHGSSLFTRGVTQALNVVTLAPLSFAQVVDTMEVTDGERRYMHHYNAPSYTVGEPGRMGSPGRREIGHGYLAERAIIPVLPSEEEFPYAIRSVTEIMSQNGSTSMAATCASCMALMDAGVPIKNIVSGIAMGLIVDGDKFFVLSDIADAEDFAGDMDFKVTGTSRGITAVQMDMKVHGLPVDVLASAILQSKEGREFIGKHIASIIEKPRPEISSLAPRIEKIKINPMKIGAVIGKGGEMINKITTETGALIDIKEDGLITVASSDAESIEKAMEWIKSLTEEPEVGKVYNGKVVGIKDFGAFVNILPGVDGMLHISRISEQRVNKVEDVLNMGQEVKVKIETIEKNGKIALTMRGVG
ncbi:polyribonucleotide nucleotidyltransferase [Candidatus Saccharibacteria bacterium]|nr:polyribonucleotide nucleotidyltransferase [Candidatus Saccharibacteria bacterium]